MKKKEEVINPSKIITYEQLANAFNDLLDGWGWDYEEIRRITGLPVERCKDISNIFNNLNK